MADFILSGFHSPEYGNTETLYDINLVNRDLLNHFYTMKGERVMNYDYGFVGWDMLFDLQTDFNQQALEDDVNRIIDEDPRVSVISITVSKIDYGFNISIILKYMNTTVDELFISFTEDLLSKKGT